MIDRAEALKRAEKAYHVWRELCLDDNIKPMISGISKMEQAIAEAIEQAVRETALECARDRSACACCNGDPGRIEKCIWCNHTGEGSSERL